MATNSLPSLNDSSTLRHRCGDLRLLRKQPPSSFLMKIEDYWTVKSEAEQKGDPLKARTYESEDFEVGGYTWKLILCPEGNEQDGGQDHISLYLQIQDSLSPGEEVVVDMKLSALKHDEKENKFLMVRDHGAKIFDKDKTTWGFGQFLSTENFIHDGYLKNKSCQFGAEIFIIKKPTQEPSKSPSKIWRSFRDFDPAHCIFRIDSFSEICDDERIEPQDAVFKVGGFKWQVALYPSGHGQGKEAGYISLYLKIIDEDDEFPEDWNVYAFFKLFIRDQLNNKYLMVQESLGDAIKCFDEYDEEHGIDEFLSLKEFRDPSKGYLREDKCYFGVEVFVLSPPAGLKPFPYASDGTYEWTIEDFSSKREKCASPPFIFGGTAWVLRVYPNGKSEAKGEYLSVFLALFEPDDGLDGDKEWLVVKSFVLCNANPSMNKVKRSKEVTYSIENVKWGKLKFIKLEEMTEENGFVQDDTVTFQVKFHSVVNKGGRC